MSSIRLAVDIGSSKTAIYQVGGGVILSEPSIVAVSSVGRKSVVTVGKEAKKLLGKSANGTSVIFPVSEGEIARANYAENMLKEFFRRIELSSFTSSEVLAVIPCGLEGKKIQRFREVFSAAGANNVKFLENPIAVAVGMNAPVTESDPCFVIDMGGEITNIAAASLDGVIAGVSVNVGGVNIDNRRADSRKA